MKHPRNTMMLAFDAAPKGTPGYGLRKGLPFVIPLDKIDVQTALHEASHCVVSIVQGCQITEVGIAQDGSGCCSRRARPNAVLPMESNAAIYVAGLCGNQIAGNMKHPRSYARDLGKLRKLAKDAGMDDDAAYILYGRACGRSRTILKEFWPAVMAIATKLCKRRVLRGAEVQTIFKEAIKCSP